jgi:CRISPR-associated protein Csd1
MIRGYLQGKCEDLYKAFDAWYSDIGLESSDGSDKAIKLDAVYIRLLRRRKNERNITERISKELSGISTRILTAIINNSPLPDMMAVNALSYIRSEMVDNGEDKNSPIIVPDKTCCRILKAWLIRKYGKERTGIMKSLNTESPSVAYHTGRMVAVFAAIQNEALDGVGAGIIERYYSSACSSPALVIGKLSSLSQYHLSKIKNEAYKTRYKKMLEEISQKIGCSIPKTFGLEEQSQFALGYYQQCAKLFEKKETVKEAVKEAVNETK